jgi:hypothetical protein
MTIGRGNRSTRRKPVPAPLCPQQIPHHYIRVWTRVAAVGSQRLNAWATARPNSALCKGTIQLHRKLWYYLMPREIFSIDIVIIIIINMFWIKISGWYSEGRRVCISRHGWCDKQMLPSSVVRYFSLIFLLCLTSKVGGLLWGNNKHLQISVTLSGTVTSKVASIAMRQIKISRSLWCLEN